MGFEAGTEGQQVIVQQTDQQATSWLKVLWLCVLVYGCISTPPGITLRPVPRPTPPDPVALSHFVNARLHELQGHRDQAITSLRAAIAIDTKSATLYGALARNLAALERYAEATLPANKSLQRNANDLQVRWIYYESLLKGLGDTTLALEQLESIARHDPEPIKALDQMLKVHDARNDSTSVLRTLDRISALPGLEEGGKLIAAQNYQIRGENSKAEQLIQNVLNRNPARGDAWVKLANLQVVRGDTLAGARSLRSALRHPTSRVNPHPVMMELVKIYGPATRMDSLLNESPPDTLFQEHLGEIYRQVARTGDPKRSAQLLERSLALYHNLTRLSPSRADLLAKQGELLLHLNRPGDARRSFIQAGKLDNRAEYHLGTAHTMLFERRYGPAIQILENIKPRMTPGTEFYDKTMLSLGNAYSAMGRNQEAREIYQASIEAVPDNTAYPYELGETYIRDANWEQAASIFRDLLPRVEKNSTALGQTLYSLARTLERNGEFDESARRFERLLSLHPNHADALNYLGYMFAEKGVRLGEAESFIKRALETDPNNGAYLDSLGWVYYQAKDYRRAQEFLQKAISQEEEALKRIDLDETGRRRAISENLAVIYDHAGDCAFAINQFGEARRRWTQALENNPNIPRTQEKLNALALEHGSGTGGEVAP